LKLSKIPSYAGLSPRLTQLDLVSVRARPLFRFLTREAETYGVPFMWGPNTLLYNTDVFREPPTTWAVLWDPKYSGKISLWDDISTVYMAAQVLGYDQPDPNALYHLSDQQLDVVNEKLLGLKGRVFRDWSTATELETFFTKGDVVAAMGWPLITKQLKEQGFPIGEVIPKENTTGWIDYLMIPMRSQHPVIAYDFVNFMLREDVQTRVARATGYVAANERAALTVTKGVEIQSLWKRIYFWQTLSNRTRYAEVWSEARNP
jgi:putative spermidine/putrescine transport system substrate-binding protein/spermidine/putrescine transport system substrate-binding protein